jgi:nitroimidazol reductase NimA-like FMN-containing flavoprotein (pyridoxamine 5'-phosphate oxidase superfamily)
MSHTECVSLLGRNNIGRLGCSYMHQPYITPVHFAYDGGHIYSFSIFGQKISWMRENNLVCLQVEELKSSQEWSTILATGKFEELGDSPAPQNLRRHAYDLLSKRAMWWEPASARVIRAAPDRPNEIVYFRIIIEKISGRMAVRDQPTAMRRAPRK